MSKQNVNPMANERLLQKLRENFNEEDIEIFLKTIEEEEILGRKRRKFADAAIQFVFDKLELGMENKIKMIHAATTVLLEGYDNSKMIDEIKSLNFQPIDYLKIISKIVDWKLKDIGGNLTNLLKSLERIKETSIDPDKAMLAKIEEKKKSTTPTPTTSKKGDVAESSSSVQSPIKAKD